MRQLVPIPEHILTKYFPKRSLLQTLLALLQHQDRQKEVPTETSKTYPDERKTPLLVASLRQHGDASEIAALLNTTTDELDKHYGLHNFTPPSP